MQPVPPPLENVLIPVAVTGVVNLMIWAGGLYAQSKRERVTLKSNEARQLAEDQAAMRKELLADNQRLRDQMKDMRNEQQACEDERDQLQARVRALELRSA